MGGFVDIVKSLLTRGVDINTYDWVRVQKCLHEVGRECQCVQKRLGTEITDHTHTQL